MGIEGGHAIENDLHLLDNFYRLGARYMTLTWSNTNEWADSSGDVTDPKIEHHNGLTDFGKQVVLEMNRLGMMVDISHVADKTFWDAIATTKAPVIASHSSARALVDAPRNMTDDMLRAVAKNGGVVMVNFYSSFLSEDYRKAAQAMQPAINGAWVTAAIRQLIPAIAQSVALVPGSAWGRAWASAWPSNAPAAPPANMVGVKTPPTVPVLTQNVVASRRMISSSPSVVESRSVTAPAAVGVITGLGAAGYLLALEYLIDRDK